MRIFQNYHRHSHYTNPRVSDAAVTNLDYARRAAELGHGILSSCEHGWQGNYFECHNLARDHKLKFLFSCEAYWVKEREALYPVIDKKTGEAARNKDGEIRTARDSTNAHIFLGAKNENGRQALNDALSEANISGFYNRPRLDIPLLLSLPPEDVWVTTACVAYWQYADIDAITRQLAEHFGDSFFLEVQYHNTEKQQLLNQHILELHRSLHIPLIMGCDSHYIFEDGSQKRTDFLTSKGMYYPDEEGWFMDYPDGEEAYHRFARQGVLSHGEICEAIENTNVFLDVEPYDSPVFNTEIKLPTLCPTRTQEERDLIYKGLVWQGWKEYRDSVPKERHEEYLEEIRKEVQTVVDTHMADYFIDNYYIIKRGKELGGRLTKTGRGSGVSFITNKLLGFTEVDRIAAPVKMYPERFMSTTRILQSGSLPDFDFNTGDVEPFARAQQEVLGEDHAYPMLAYGTMKAPAAWKLYAKSQNIPFEIANEVSRQLKKYEMAVKHAEEDERDDINPDDYISAQYIDIYNKSKEYQSIVDSWSIAPCSYLLYQGSIRREIGLVMIKDNLCCCLDGHAAEENHFLKNDLLKVSVVDLIYRAYDRAGVALPDVQGLLSLCPPEDPAWKLYATGCTMALNQVEQTGTSARVKEYKPTNISELCAFVAAIRPGFKSMYRTFAERQPFAYGVKAFDDLIQTEEMPNSFILYQEQEMAALHYAGIPMDECYTAIKNIAKKRADKVIAYKDQFVAGIQRTITQEEGRSQEEAEKISHDLWQIIEDSASYSFNASHSYSVSIDSLYSAWIKAHHPYAFYEVAMEIADEKSNKTKMAALQREAADYFRIRMEPFRFGQDNRRIVSHPDTGTITNKLTSIKGFGNSICTLLYDCARAEPETFMDVLQWLDARSIKAAKVQPLINIDYFVDFGNIPTLSRILELFDFFKQGTVSRIKKDKLSPDMEELISGYGTDKGTKGNILTSWTITDMDGLLREGERRIKALNLPDLSMKLRIQNTLDILGYIGVQTGREEDRCTLAVLETWPMTDKRTGHPWAYRISVQSIGTGKTAELSIHADRFEKKPIHERDLIITRESDLSKNRKGYWYLSDWEIVA